MDDEIPYYQEIRIPGDSFLNKLKRITTSSVLFILSFIISNLLLQAIIAVTSIALKHTVKFSYDVVGVYPWDYHYWRRLTIIMIFFFSPLFCFIIGLVIFNLLRVYSNWSNVLRIFFFWLAVNLINMVLTHALLAPLGSPVDRGNGLYQTFAVVGAWLWINPTLMAVVAVGALASTLLFGVMIRKEVMRYSFSKKLIASKKGMDKIVIQVFVMPVIVGSLPVILLCSAYSVFTTAMEIANLGVVSIGIFMMNSVGTATVRCNKTDILNHFPILESAICAAVWYIIYTYLK